MIVQPTKTTIKKLIIDNLDSGKLILIDPKVDREGKDHALAEVAKQTGIPIFTTKEQAYYLNRIAGCEVAWYTELQIMSRGVELGFMVDEGVDLLRIMSLKDRVLPQNPIPQTDDFSHYLFDNHNHYYDKKYGVYKEIRLRLRTGFFNNDLFSTTMINEECDDSGEPCDNDGHCTPLPTPFPTPQPGCATPAATPVLEIPGTGTGTFSSSVPYFPSVESKT